MLIVHRCTIAGCGHPDVWGKRDRHPVLGLTGALPTNCGQGCHPKCQWNPQPEAMPRIHSDGTPIAEVVVVSDVIAPGTSTPWYTSGSTHDCAACRDLYQQLTGQAVPS